MKHFFLVALTYLGVAGVLPAAPGDVDLTFDPGSGVNGPVYSVVVQTDGKVIIGGVFSTVRGAVRNCIARLNADGTVDSSFNPGSGADNGVLCLAVQTDGKVLLGGSFSSINGTNRNCIARLNADGSLDSTFNPSLWVDNAVHSIAVQTDGKVLLGGDGIWGIVRLKADGSYDNTFQLDMFEDDWSHVSSVTVQTDGKVVVGGDFTAIKGTNWNCLARLNTNGTLDTSFDPGTGANYRVNSVVVHTDGKLFVGGDFTIFNGTNRNHIARLIANGSLDTTFNPGSGANMTVRSVAVQTDGMVLVGGDFTTFSGTPRNCIARLNSSGSVDGTFNPGTAPSTNVHSVVVQTDGKVLVGGGFSILWGPTDRKALTRLNANGGVDSTFNADTRVNGSIDQLCVQPDGKVLVAGSFTFINGTNRSGIARLNADGSLDGTFNPGSGAGGVDPAYAPYNLVDDVTVQPDGKVIMAGAFTTMNGTGRSYVARLEANGSLDNTFDPVWNPTWGPNGPVKAIALQPDGKLLVAGGVIGGLLRRSTNGSVDSMFTPWATGGYVLCLAVQPDGKILIGGYFTAVNGTNRNGIARLNTDGSLDGTFDPGSGVINESVYCIALQTDGKVLLGGSFNFVSGGNLRRIARLNPNGSLDSTFNPGTGANDHIFSVATQPDGKILLAGMFSTINGITRNRIARLNADGSLDTTFDPVTGPTSGNYNRVHSVVVQSDGKILAGGDFTVFNGITRSYAVRLLGDPILNIQKAGDRVVLSWTHDTFSLQSAQWVTGTYTNVPGAISPYTNPIIGPQRYFRLKAN